jgi:hypothetical protein
MHLLRPLSSYEIAVDFFFCRAPRPRCARSCSGWPTPSSELAKARAQPRAARARYDGPRACWRPESRNSFELCLHPIVRCVPTPQLFCAHTAFCILMQWCCAHLQALRQARRNGRFIILRAVSAVSAGRPAGLDGWVRRWPRAHRLPERPTRRALGGWHVNTAWPALTGSVAASASASRRVCGCASVLPG